MESVQYVLVFDALNIKSTEVKLWKYIASSIIGVPGDMAVNIFVGTTVKNINDAVAGYHSHLLY